MSEAQREEIPLYLRFKVAQVIKLAAHAHGAPKHRMTLDQRQSHFDTLEPVEGEEAVCPEGLWLVKDAGIYLMSNGLPHRKGFVEYAYGFDVAGLRSNWEAVRRCIGGDDFVDFIPMHDVLCILGQKFPNRPDHEFIIGLGQTKMWLE